MGIFTEDVKYLTDLFRQKELNIPTLSFGALFGEPATPPFFVFQLICVAVWVSDKSWYYIPLTLFMLVVFECPLVW